MSQDTLRFLGLTKTQFLGILLTVVVLLCTVMTWIVIRQSHNITQGAQSHAALCVLKSDYVQRESDNKAFLRLTVKQRVAKYGPALGHIPPAVITQSLRIEQANVQSLQKLHCP